MMMRFPTKLQLAVMLLLALVYQYPQCQALARSKCPPAKEAQMDACAARMGFLGNHEFTVPKNLTKMEGFCRELKDSINCIQAYSRECLQGFTKQILTSLLKRGKQQYSLICNSDSSKRDMMNKLACLTDDKIGEFHTCMDASVARYEFIRANVKPENRLPGLCCSYSLFNMDIDETIARICPQSAAATTAAGNRGQGNRPTGGLGDTSDFIHKVASGTAGEFFALVCDNHRTYDECRTSSKTKDTLRRLESITRQVRAGKLKPKSKSLIPPLLDVLDSSDAINQ